LLDQRAGKAGNCIVKCVGRLAGAGRGDGLCRQSGTFADQGVCAQAVLAAIGLTGSQRNDLALGGTQAAGAQRFGQAEVAVERQRRDRWSEGEPLRRAGSTTSVRPAWL